MSSNLARKGGRKNRKWKRNILKCARYRAEHRREKNKVRKLRRHLKKHSGDGQARGVYGNLALYH